VRWLWLLLLLLLPSSALAQDAGVAEVKSSCIEYLPEGATRPKLSSELPRTSLSGYAVELVVTIEHGPGETVMPDGFRINRGGDAMIALRESGWVIPEADGGVGPRIDRQEGDATHTTKVAIPFVPLPDEPGRHLMALPPMPITVARANGQVMTLCTQQHSITIEDPIANEVEPEVRGNPDPRPQRDEWKTAKNFAFGALIVIALALVLAWLLHRWRSRPKVEPSKPKVLPWIVAMRELDDIRRSDFLKDGKLDEYFNRVDQITRLYIGERYGFDGLESTSGEIRGNLSRVYPSITDPKLVEKFLADGDFVKYAEVTPRREDCEQAIAAAEDIVRLTTPPNAVRLDPDAEEDPKRAA
jgi:hypothetical protein